MIISPNCVEAILTSYVPSCVWEQIQLDTSTAIEQFVLYISAQLIQNKMSSAWLHSRCRIVLSIGEYHICAYLKNPWHNATNSNSDPVIDFSSSIPSSAIAVWALCVISFNRICFIDVKKQLQAEVFFHLLFYVINNVYLIHFRHKSWCMYVHIVITSCCSDTYYRCLIDLFAESNKYVCSFLFVIIFWI